MFDLPPLAGPARDRAILAHVEAGDFTAPFATVHSSYNGINADFYVFADALKIAGVRVSVSAYLEQQVADLLSCSLLTAKLADLRWAQRAVTLPPLPRPITSSTAAMVDQSARVDRALSVTPETAGIVDSLGKAWLIDALLDAHPGRAINYGWHFTGPTYAGHAWDSSVTGVGRVIQGRGWAHDFNEVDYSQICCLVSRTCVVDRQKVDLWELLRDPALAPLASASGALRTHRQPGVPALGPIIAIAEGPTPVYG